MKKFILITLGLANYLTLNAQENKIQLHTVEIGFGGFYSKQNPFGDEIGGATFVADITTSIGKNLISTSFLTGAEIGIVGNSTYNFNEFRIQYGRELKVKKWLRFELFTGIGHYKVSSLNIENNTISFPLKFNTKFYFNEKFGLGINTNYSINSISNNFSTNLIFQYKFN
ncbi:hypothetical protein [Flavobacterium sp.]|uniref:hypothetical protein n=1 Tax=Flavobacterium sp. TaxID=239 RepID=UPI004047B92E